MLDLLGPNCTGMSLKVVASMSLVLDEPRTAQQNAAADSDMIFNNTDNMVVNDDANNNVNDDVMSGDANGIDNTAPLDDEPEDDDRIRLEDINIDPDEYNPRSFNTSYNPKMDFCVTSTLWKKMLVRRAMTEVSVAEINDISHGVPENTDKLVDILFDIHNKRQRIVILPDFDMDGISAGTLGFAGLAELGFTVSLYIPDPNEGYGFGPKQVDRIVMQYPDVAAIITCDNGITCFDGINHGNDLGIRMLVTDHHQPGKIPTNAEVEVDPMRGSDGYAHPQICGAVVLWQVLSAYAAKYCDTFMQEQIARLVVFAGFGTVSDCMPMMYENRAFVSRSIDILRLVYDNGSYDFVNNLSGCDIYRAAFKGLRVMLDAFVDKGYFDPVVATEKFYGWSLAPTFNSVKRLGEDMHDAFGVFFDVANAQAHMRRLIELNELRKQLVNREYQRLVARLEDGDMPYGPYIFVTDSDPGVAGLLATKLMAHVDGPVFVLTHRDGETSYHGSGRSPVWYQALTRLRKAGFAVAGHELAFGAGAKDERTLKAFAAFLETDVEQERELNEAVAAPGFLDWAVGWHVGFAPDGDVDLNDFAMYINDIDMNRPFGPGFDMPQGAVVFDPRDPSVEYRRMGAAGQHTKITLANGLSMIQWNLGDKIEMLRLMPYVAAIGEIGYNEFRGVTSMQIVGDFVGFETSDELQSWMLGPGQAARMSDSEVLASAMVSAND